MNLIIFKSEGDEAVIQFYGYKNCSSCKSAEKFLTQNKIAYNFIDVTNNPPSAKDLARFYKNSGLELKKFLNTSGEVYRELGLKDKLTSMSEDEIIKLLASNGRLIKRPLIANDLKVTLGFKEESMKVWTSK
jgi:arsenate reductase